MQHIQCLRSLGGGHNHRHADAHIEGIEHIAFGNAAFACNHFKYGRGFDRCFLNLRGKALAYGARDIFIETAAGDMRDALNAYFPEQFQNRLDINARRREQFFAQRARELRTITADSLRTDIEHLPHKRKTV